MSAIQEIAAERQKQVAKGFTADHDDEHDAGKLAWEAECVLVGIGDSWGILRKHGNDKRRRYLIAAALIVAEIERMDRAKKAGAK